LKKLYSFLNTTHNKIKMPVSMDACINGASAIVHDSCL